MDDTAAVFGENLRRIREARGWTQKDLARAVGDLTEGAISNWERGEYAPRLEKMLLVADVLRVSLDELWGRDELVGKREDPVPRLGQKRERRRGERKASSGRGGNTWSAQRAA